MASASATLGFSPPRASPTLRQFSLAFVWAAGAVALGCAVYVVETILFAPPRQFLESPIEVTMRALALAHFVIAWVFLFTSPHLRGPTAAGRLAFWTLLGVALCAAFALVDGYRNPLTRMLFYGYFLLHEAGDQAHFFTLHGEAPRRPRADSLLTHLKYTVCLLFMALLAGMFLIHAFIENKASILQRSEPVVLLAGLGVLTLAAVTMVVATLREALMQHGSLTRFARAYAPLFQVYAGILTVLLVGSLFGSGGFNLIVLIHVTGWLVHVQQRLAARQPRPANLWAWCRWTPQGFVTVHLTLALAFLMLFALRVHAWDRSGWFCQALAASSFPFWTLMHISMSFWRVRIRPVSAA